MIEKEDAPILVGPDGKTEVKSSRFMPCPNCGADYMQRLPSCGFGVPYLVCRCGFEFKELTCQTVIS